MNTTEIPDEIVELTAMASKPHLWNGKLYNALAQFASFTDAQAKEQVERKQKEIRDEIRAVLEIAAPALIAAERSKVEQLEAEINLRQN